MIEQLLNDYLAKEQEERKTRERSGKFNPSSFGQCYRRQIWNRGGFDVTDGPDDRQLRVFLAGRWFHEGIQRLLPPHETEVLVELEDVKGYADIVTTDTVIDLKSQHSRAFWYMTRDNYNVEVSRRNSILQVMFYCLALYKPWGRLVYISKDDLCIKEYLFKLDDWKAEVHDELYVLQSFWDREVLPSAEPRCFPDKDGIPRECKYCQFKTKCEETDKGMIEKWTSQKETQIRSPQIRSPQIRSPQIRSPEVKQ